MRSQDMSADEIVRVGMQIYEQQLKSLLEPEHHGRFVAVAIEDGDYEVKDTSLAADDALRERHPDAVFYVGRIGYAWSLELLTPYYDAPVRTR